MGKVAYTIRGAAKAASVTENDILKAISNRKIVAVRVNEHAIIPRVELARWISAQPDWYSEANF